jgi:hypothetical protein
LVAVLTLSLPAFSQAPRTPPSITTASVLPAALAGTKYAQTLTASGTTPITWSLTTGALPPGLALNGSTGLISGTPTAQGAVSFTVCAANAFGSSSKQLSLTVNAPVSVTITPGTATLTPLQTQTFTASVSNTSSTGVTWSLSPAVGTLSPNGAAAVYTAPSIVNLNQTVQITATSMADSTKFAQAVVSLLSAVTVSVAPAGITLNESQTQTFNATVTGASSSAVNWSLSSPIGTVSTAGLYTAPATLSDAETVQVIAQSAVNPGQTGRAPLTLRPTKFKVSVSPASVSLSASQTQQFTATVAGISNSAVTWSVKPAVGTISSAGLYTAPSSIPAGQNIVVTAASVANPAIAGTATVALVSPVSVSLTPATATLLPSQTQSLTATVTGTSTTGVTWTVNPSLGSFASSGTSATFIAPSTAPTTQIVTITATSVADPSKSASAVFTLMQAVTLVVSPSSVTLGPSGTQQFTAAVSGSSNTAVTWSINPAVGTISSTGLYTAPSSIPTAQTVTVNATSAADQTKTASGSVTLVPPIPSLAYCSFTSQSAPCADSNVAVQKATLDPAGKMGNGLRICKGPGCPGGSTLRLNGTRLSVRRGTIAFWFKQNNNNPSANTEIFNSYPGNPYVQGTFNGSVQMTARGVTTGTVTTLTVAGHGLSNGATVRVSGGTGAWSALNADWTVTIIDANNFTIPLNSSTFDGFSGVASILTAGSVNFTYTGALTSPITYGVFKTDSFFLPAGEWHHIIWSWTADRHSVYRDGVLVASYDSTSPFPHAQTFSYFTLGTSGGGTQDITIDEFGSYDFAFTPHEAAALYISQTPGAQGKQDPHGISTSAVWGPGQQQVKVSIDAGNDYQSQAQTFRADVYQNGVVVASQEFPVLHNGFAEGVITLPGFPSGTYSVLATASGASGVLGTATSTSYTFTKPTWLGNSYGIDSTVPAPFWDPITTTGAGGLTMNVVNRSYALQGGYGLPMQITSLGQTQLTSPVMLEVVQGATTLPVVASDLTMTGVQANQATWQGSGTAGASVKVSVTGSLEYDGMMLLKIDLAPTGNAVTIDTVRLKTTLTSAAAEYVFAVKDQPFWWYVWSVRTPQAVGEFNNNLSTAPRMNLTNNIFSVVFSDNNRGLEIFHNNMAGWQINESSPWQRFIRNADGSVTYECDLANQTFTLSQPIEITVGYMATPVKRMPANWRLAVGGAYGGSQAPQSDLEYHWDFSLGNTWTMFNLFPTNLARYKSGITGIRSQNTAYGKKVLPFTNAHVLVPTAPLTWADLNMIAAETLNDGWNSSPSRGEADYWAYSMNHLLNDPTTPNAVDGYYIDESYTYLANSSLLTGAGYIKADGSHGVGMNLLGAREIVKRLAKILIAAGKTPNLWMHTTAYSAPHMLSHAMMTLDGERPNSGVNYYIDATSNTSADHFDIWNNNNSLLDPTQPGNGTWLLGTAATSKFGFIPNMWGGIQCCGEPFTALKKRQAECLYQMHDILQQDQDLAWWQPKYNFGINQPDVTFHEYQSQQEIQTSDPSVKVTYYERSNSILAYIANFNSTDWSGSVTFAGGYSKLAPVQDAETGLAISMASGALPVTVGRHNCRVVQLGKN